MIIYAEDQRNEAEKREDEEILKQLDREPRCLCGCLCQGPKWDSNPCWGRVVAIIEEGEGCFDACGDYREHLCSGHANDYDGPYVAGG